MINYRFKIKKKLGEGRSRVFLCRDTENPEKQYAIKILPKTGDRNEIKTFRDEFFILQRLNHPNIITSYEEGVVTEDDDEWDIRAGSSFIVLDYFEGEELLKYEKIQNEDCLRIILIQVCSALYYLHQSNYIYYDLKPENILVGEKDDKPVIKLIDMGFAHHSSSSDRNLIRGTAEYIAPEILKKENHNHQADLYSLGIMLYRLAYGKFPFISKTELDIYKEQIEREFDYPKSIYADQFINIIKKLLVKDPSNRYYNTLQVLGELQIKFDGKIVGDFSPANVFADREDVLMQMYSYLSDAERNDVILISGAEGAGKTSLIYKIYSERERVIILTNTGKKSIEFLKYFLRNIITSEHIYRSVNKEILKQTDRILFGESGDIVAELKAVITKISSEIKFCLVIDDFNLLDDFSINVCSEILPILQVNGIKIILTERSDHVRKADRIIGKISDINLAPFTEDNLSNYLNEALASFFPKEQLKKLIIKHADLLPGSIVSFIRDLILLNVIRFTPDGPEILLDSETERLLEGFHEEIFRLRLSLLTQNEINLVRFISSFENVPEIRIISGINNLPVETIYQIFNRLEEKNIMQISGISNAVSFTSESLKKYIYSTIDDKENHHLKIAEAISNTYKAFNRQELARQYELGGEYISGYRILVQELDEAERLSAYTYMKSILNHLLELPLPGEYKTELKFLLSRTLFRLNDVREALNIAEELLGQKVGDKKRDELLILKGSCLIELGEQSEGKNLLSELIKKIDDDKRKHKLMVEIAFAEFDLGSYDTVKKICLDIIGNINAEPEERGKCYNLLGLVDFYQNLDPDKALNNFQNALDMYQSAGLPLNVAKMEVNIGNIYNIKGDSVNAEKYWNISLQRNLSIGNLDQQAKLLLNLGGFYYNKANFEKACEHYNKAYNIFVSMGNKNGQGLVFSNLGETYLSSCEYQNAFDSLTQAKDIFKKLTNLEEEAEVSFLLCKYFFVYGDHEQFKTELNSLKNLTDNNNLPDRQNNNLKFLEIINSFSNKENGKYSEILEKQIFAFKEHNEGLFLAESFFILSELLIQINLFDTTLIFLDDNKYSKICNENSFCKAQKYYLQSIISSKNSNFKLSSQIELLNEAYNLIKDQHITELTWKVLFSLGEYYFSRGNLRKAQDYLFYCKQILNFISGNITDEDMRNKYLSKPERKNALGKITEIGNI